MSCFGLSPQRGSHKLAQGKRPSGASPWVETAKDLIALKGRHYFVSMSRAAHSGLSFLFESPTQGVALGWPSIAPLGLNTEKTQPHNSYFKFVCLQHFSPFASLRLCVFALSLFPQRCVLMTHASGDLNDKREAT